MNAIPTMYRGIQMRSRLEATWAAFFDQLGWHWEYEPIDLDGWVPDFLLRTQSRVYYVEVKPITSRSEFDPYWPKIAAAKPNHAVLLVGAGLFQDYDGFENVLLIGQIRERICSNCGYNVICEECCCGESRETSIQEIHDCVIGQCGCGRTGFCGFDDLNGNFISSCCSNHAHRDIHISVHGEGNTYIQTAWARAKNASQWRPPR